MYLILVHQDPNHLNRLVNKLDYNSDIYVHLVKKADINYSKMRK
jgi:hypothetical protein